jgi:hypothetical protein
VIPVKLNVDKPDVAKIATKYNVSAIPAIFVMNADGKVLGTVEFTSEPAQFNARLRAILTKNHVPAAGHTIPKKHHK